MADSNVSPSSLDYVSNNLNANDLFSTWERHRDKTLIDLINDPSKLVNSLLTNSSFLGIDLNCLFNMSSTAEHMRKGIFAKNKMSPLLRRQFKCNNCRLLDLLIDFDSGGDKSYFVIESGVRQDQTLFVSSHQYSKLEVILKSFDRCYFPNSDKCQSIIENFSVCPSSEIEITEKFTSLATTNFLNEILVNWYAFYLCQQQRMPNINSIYTGFVCGKESYLVKNLPPIVGLNDFLARVEYDDVILEFLSQLFAVLSLLKKNDLSLGNFDSSSSFMFETIPVS